MTWTISNVTIDQDSLLKNESLLSIGNGYLGVRGNFEEGYPNSYQSIRGMYINAFFNNTKVNYGEKFHGYPETTQKLVNIMDAQTVNIIIDGEPFSVFEGEVLEFKHQLNLDNGYNERTVHWKSPKGKEVKITFRKMASFVTKELFAHHIDIEPVSSVAKIDIVSILDGDVENFADKSDPRVASESEKHLAVTEIKRENGFSILKSKTLSSNLEVACVRTSSVAAVSYDYSSQVNELNIVETYTCNGNGTIHFTQLNVFTDTLRHGDDVIEDALNIQSQLQGVSFSELLLGQKDYLDDFWQKADIKIEGETSLQEGIRFNCFHLLQSVGKDSISNIAAKGLSGEGYEGHYFWDTEIYIFPFFLMTSPELAKNLLVYRYNLLDDAKKRAKDLGHSKGALFPWRTITGPECSTYYPAGTAQYHISADIAYSFIQYYLVTKDEAFLKDYMAELLFETARLWLEVGHMSEGSFKIDCVTGPDEYTCLVNNNYYTNSMAKHNLLWAEKVYQWLAKNDKETLVRLMGKIDLLVEEAEAWGKAGRAMFLPYDNDLKINAQDDSFLKKERWNLKDTPKDQFPLLLNYHPLTLYRYQVCKQADTVLSHFLLEDGQDFETIKNSYDYYEEITTHDSSLSYCIFSIMGSKLGNVEKAYNYFNKTARLDLDNIHGNTKDGLHMANMAGTWLSLVFGFAGLRIKESGLYLEPRLPHKWNYLTFRIQYCGRLIEIQMNKEAVHYYLLEGKDLTIYHFAKPILLKSRQFTEVPYKTESMRYV